MDNILVNSGKLLSGVFGSSIAAAFVWHIWYVVRPAWINAQTGTPERNLENIDKTKINFGIMAGFSTLGATVGLLSATVAPTIGGAALPALVTVLLGYLASKPGAGTSTDAAGGPKSVNLLARTFMSEATATDGGQATDAGMSFVWVPARVLLASLALFWSVSLGYNWNSVLLKEQATADAAILREQAATIVNAAHQQALDLVWLKDFVIACKMPKDKPETVVNCDAPRPAAPAE
jgi:hypothetical protein